MAKTEPSTVDRHSPERDDGSRWSRFDPTVDRLTPFDLELVERGRLDRTGPPPPDLGDELESVLATRARHLFDRGLAGRDGHGVSFDPKAFERLRDADIRHAMARDLDLPGAGPLSHGWAAGVIVGEIATVSGPMAVSARTIGHAVAPIPAGATIEIGREVGREVGRDQGFEHGG